MISKHIRQEKDRRTKNLHAHRLRKRLAVEQERLDGYREVLKQQEANRTLSSYQFRKAQDRVFYHSKLCNGLRVRIAKNSS